MTYSERARELISEWDRIGVVPNEMTEIVRGLFEQQESLREAILELPRAAAPGPYTYASNEDLDRFWKVADEVLGPAKKQGVIE